MSFLAFAAGCGSESEETHAASATVLDQAWHIESEAVKKEQGWSLRLTIFNREDEDLNLTFPSAEKVRFILKDESDNVVFNSSEGQMFTQALEEVQIPSGDSDTWQLETGDLQAEAVHVTAVFKAFQWNDKEVDEKVRTLSFSL